MAQIFGAWRSRKRDSIFWFDALLLAVILFAVAALRLRLLGLPLDRDEGEYAYMGQLMLNGVPPYRDASNMKLPGTYGAYALIQAVFGQSIEGLRLGFLFVNLLTIAGVFLVARRLFDVRRGVWAAAIFAVMSQSPALLALAGQATHFINLCAVAALLWLLRAVETRRARDFLGSGFLLGLAFLMKQQAVFFIPFALFYALWALRGTRGLAPRRAAILLFGSVLPYALVVAGLWLSGDFPAFWFWTVEYARAYTGINRLSDAWEIFKYTVRSFVNEWPLWILGLVGFVLLGWKTRSHRVFLSAWLVASILTVLPGLYLRSHYFITLLPVIAIAGAGGLFVLEKEIAKRTKAANGQLAANLCVTVVLCAALFPRWDEYSLGTPFQLMRWMYGTSPFPEAVDIANYIARSSTPDARIAVIGSEPQIYFYARRRAATGFLYAYPLMEFQQYAPQMQRKMASEIEKNRPQWIVYENVNLAWIAGKGVNPWIFEWFDRYRQNYTPVAIVEIHPKESVWVWNPPPSYRPAVEDYLTIWRRNAP